MCDLLVSTKLELSALIKAVLVLLVHRVGAATRIRRWEAVSGRA